MRSFIIMAWVLVAAFLYKVANERQMTRMYERQAAALERLADRADDGTNVLTNVQAQDDYAVRVVPTLPTLGGTALEHCECHK